MQYIFKLNKLNNYKYICNSFLIVFILGILTIFLAKVIFYSHHPEYYIDSIPTISKSAAFSPGSIIFKIGMTTVAISTFISWCLVYKLNTYRINKISIDETGFMILKVLCACVLILGTAAAIFLALLTNITLEDNSDIHISFSKYFFVTEIFAFITDSICYAILIKYSNNYKYQVEIKSYYLRYIICILVIFTSVIYFFLFEYRDIFVNEYIIQIIYVISEDVTVFLCLSYLAAYFSDIKKHITLIYS